jgi:SAM-dependent methyltransferase
MRSVGKSSDPEVSGSPADVGQPSGSLASLAPLTRGQRRRFEQLRREWADLGESAYEWAVLGVDPLSARPGEERFLEIGRELWGSIEQRARSLGLRVSGSRALDFGCGPGRFSQSLAGSYDHVLGLDVAPSMVELAKRIDRAGTKCEFQRWERPDLAGVESGSRSLAFSAFVFQHLPHWLSTRYLRELVRVTEPGGTIIVQVHGDISVPVVRHLPAEGVSAAARAARRLRLTAPGTMLWEVHWMKPSTVVAALIGAGASVTSVDRAAVPEGRMISYWYYARVAAE